MVVSVIAMQSEIESQLADQLLVDGVVNADDLTRTRAAATATGKRLDQALVDLGMVSETTLERLLHSAFGVVEVDMNRVPREPVLPESLAPAYLAAVRAMPLSCDSDVVMLAMCDPFDDFTAKAVSLKLQRPVVRCRIAGSAFTELFGEVYGERWLDRSLAIESPREVSDGADLDVLRDAASGAPVVRFVQSMIRDAVESGASDVHLRPRANGVEMQFRVNGSLTVQRSPDAGMLPAILSRLKVLANLDISERRLPQDGRIRTNVAGRPIDIRVSTMPHVRGEAAVLRILTGQSAASSLSKLGFSAELERGIAELFGTPEGLILVTGPTGSGKTTTLHAGLRRLIRPDVNVVTIEDPVEYRLDGAAQIQVDEKIGLSFAKVLRSLLRQDPDVILVGEIRDAETARIAVQAALTGHLVLATLHTNSALAAVPRFIDMGVEPYLLAAVLRGVLAQRLVRRLCPKCSREAPKRGGDDDDTGASPLYRIRGDGCDHCGQSGYVGRIAVGELVLLDGEVTEALAGSSDLPIALRERIRSRGYRPLQQDAQSKAQAGEIERDDVMGLSYV